MMILIVYWMSGCLKVKVGASVVVMEMPMVVVVSAMWQFWMFSVILGLCPLKKRFTLPL